MPQRTIAIGDIHGALKALIQVLERAQLQPTDKLIFLGDYVDGWSQSAQVVSYLLERRQRYECVFIKGNHDAWCEDWLHHMPPNDTWLVHGGRETIASYNGVSAEQMVQHQTFFGQLENYYTDASGRLYIHAGFATMEGPEAAHYNSSASWDRSLWQEALFAVRAGRKDVREFPDRCSLYSEIFIGHTPTLYVSGKDRPLHACNVWNIDTGAAFTGKLTAMDVATKEYWQSDVVQDLYPGEKGRNT